MFTLFLPPEKVVLEQEQYMTLLPRCIGSKEDTFEICVHLLGEAPSGFELIRSVLCSLSRARVAS